MDIEKYTDDQLAELVEFANAERGNKQLIHDQLVEMGQTTISRQMVSRWLKPDETTRKHPSLSNYFALRLAIDKLRNQRAASTTK